MKPGWQSCSRSPPRAPAGSPRPPYPGSEQLPGAQTREAEDRRPRALRLPWPALGGGAGRRAASRSSSARRSRSPLWPPPPRPSDRGWGALRPPGGPPAAVPETRAGGGGRPRRPHRPPRTEREVASNKCKLFGPPGRLGEDRRAGTGQPPARVGFAAARRGAGASPPARRGPDGGALHRPPALRSKLMPGLNPLAISHDHHRGFYLSV